MIENEFCSNKRCKDYGKIGKGNLIRYGTYKNNQIYKCKECNSRFSETKNTIFYNRKRLSKDQVLMVCRLLVEKNGIRAIERIMEIHRDTVSRLVTDLARHAKELNDFLLKDVELKETELDEFWTFVKKSKRKLDSKTARILETVIAT